MLDLDMSPYAAFVWPAWGISALVLGALIARAVIAARRAMTALKALEAEETDA
jgi:heme exporter protein D